MSMNDIVNLYVGFIIPTMYAATQFPKDYATLYNTTDNVADDTMSSRIK